MRDKLIRPSLFIDPVIWKFTYFSLRKTEWGKANECTMLTQDEKRNWLQETV
jgi:hypothetical protein